MIPIDIPIRQLRGICYDGHAGNCVKFAPIATFATGIEGPANTPGPGGPGSGPTGSGSGSGGPSDPVDQIGVALYSWVIDVRDLMEELQKTLEKDHGAATGEEQRELAGLLVRLRQCRAKVPGPEMIRAWLQFLLSSAG